MKLALDVCCGKGGATQAFRQSQDWYVLGIDNNPKMKQYWQGKNIEFLEFDVTVLDWEELKEVINNKGFDHVELLWASPPCQRFSIAMPKWPKKGIQKALEIVGACFEGIIALQPRYWVLENPRGRLRWFLGTPKQTICYSDYDSSFPVNKMTDIWGNLPLPMVKHERIIHSGHHESGWMRKHDWGYALPRDGASRAFVPLGVSEAVKTAIEAQQS